MILIIEFCGFIVFKKNIRIIKLSILFILVSFLLLLIFFGGGGGLIIYFIIMQNMKKGFKLLFSVKEKIWSIFYKFLYNIKLIYYFIVLVLVVQVKMNVNCLIDICF